MKCEHCGKNEVTFMYQSNINGKVTEKHLCGQCAEQLGYAQKLTSHSQRMMRSFRDAPLFGGSLLEDFFSPMTGLMGRMERMLESPFEDFFAEMPALGATVEQPGQEQPKEDLVSREEQDRFAKMRKMNALRMELKQAVHQENFERAARLRDELRALEAEQKEEKEHQ